MTDKKGHIYFIMGISGAGKGTVIKDLKKSDIKGLSFLRSYVTRPMREGEIDGEIYHFISKEEFQKSIDAGEFLEYEFVHKTAYYGSKWEDVVTYGIDIGKKVMTEIDIAGLRNILTNNSQLKPYITSIFLDISPEILLERIQIRGVPMTDLDLSNRLDSLEIEKIDSKKYCDYIIDTSCLTPQETLEVVSDIIKK